MRQEEPELLAAAAAWMVGSGAARVGVCGHRRRGHNMGGVALPSGASRAAGWLVERPSEEAAGGQVRGWLVRKRSNLVAGDELIISP